MKERIDLLDIKSLKDHYKNLLRDLKEKSSTSNDSDEILHNFFTSKGIKIFLIGDIQNERILIQVEVIPTAYITLEEFNDGLEERQPEIKSDILEQQISMLKNLRTLNEKGFTLNLVREECIWYVTKALETEPTEEMCESLNPLLKWALASFKVKSKERKNEGETIEK
ncbi:MAG: hypothetical protein JSW11_10385 [Candidatus Heimdallarchaeota archaeon]|nr:MAG: hypothetical protein JSW11_10385 [Candidatus Heimdallarchaeota archaeon]